MKTGFKNIIIWGFIAAWFFVATGFIARSNDEVLCREIKVNISDSLHCNFINGIDIRNSIKEAGYEVQGYPVNNIDTRTLEQLIRKNPYVENAEVYTDIQGTLYIDIDQRNPMVRVMPHNEPGFYIDHNEVVLPLKTGYTPNVLFVNGHIKFKTFSENGLIRLDLSKDKELEGLLEFSDMVNQHPFWSKQIVQIYRTIGGDFEIIPRVGAHQVIFGSMENFEDKLKGLEGLYIQGFSKYGWNKYDIINLKYSNQIICTKR